MNYNFMLWNSSKLTLRSHHGAVMESCSKREPRRQAPILYLKHQEAPFQSWAIVLGS